MHANRRNLRVLKEIGVEEDDGDVRTEVEIRPFRACSMHPVIIIGKVRSLWTWLWGRYHVSQNAFLVIIIIIIIMQFLTRRVSVSLMTKAQ